MEREGDLLRRPVSPASMAAQITGLEQEVASAERTLGPKHPARLRGRRDAALLTRRR